MAMVGPDHLGGTRAANLRPLVGGSLSLIGAYHDKTDIDHRCRTRLRPFLLPKHDAYQGHDTSEMVPFSVSFALFYSEDQILSNLNC